LESGVSESEEGRQLRDISGVGWTPERDIQAFASILFEIVVGEPAKNEASVLAHIPAFVSKILESGFRCTSESIYSFHDILEILKVNSFQIEEYVDSVEVAAFVSLVESAEQP
jgi:hypothetical protein